MGMIVNPSRFIVAGGGGSSIAFVGAKVGTYINGDPTTISLTDCLDATGAAASLMAGDLVVYTCVQATTTSTDLAQSALLPKDPSNVAYTAAHTDLWQTDSNSTNLQVSYKFMGGTPDTTVTAPACTGTNSACLHILVLRGVNTTTPLDVTPTTFTSPDSIKPNPAAITPTTSGNLISCHGGAAGGGSQVVLTRPAELSSTTNHWLAGVSGGSGLRNSLVGVGIDLGGLTTAFDCSTYGNVSVATNTSNAAVTIAWRPI